jgi:hypothetical protein
VHRFRPFAPEEPVVTYPSQDLGYARVPAPIQSASFDAEKLHWKATATYFVGCLGTVAGCYAAIACSLLFLRATDHLPPPIVTNNLCFDEKLQWMSRELPSSTPDLLVFGSSVAWRHFDSEKAIKSELTKNPYNLGFCGIRLSQTAFVIRYFLDKQKFQFPLRAVLIASPQDFEGCRGSEEQVFSKPAADEAIFSPAHAWELYFKNLDPVSFVRNATVVKAMRQGTMPLDPLILTKSGDGPLDTAANRPDLVYGEGTGLSQDCFYALRQIAKQFSDRSIEFVLLLTPINPRWISEYDPNHGTLKSLRSRIAETLKGSGAHIWDASESTLFLETDFVDAIHLRWSAAGRLTAAMTDFAKKSAD